jgi:carboxyl-terminal processing protease
VKPRLYNYLPLIFALILIMGIFIGIRLGNSRISERILLNPRTDKLNSIIDYIQENYVDAVSREQITESAITGILKNLDPHSTYIKANELEEVNESLEGNFGGIGVQFNMEKDTIIVINTVPNGPSQKVGILAGDRIVKVNDTLIAGVKMKSDQIIAKLKGPKGTKVKVSIKRPGITKLISYGIERDNIPLYSIDVAYMITPDIGFIKINKFGRTTYDEFISAVEKLRKQGLKKMIVDLRGNGGGYLDAATSIADEFLQENKLIVYTRGRVKSKKTEVFSTKNNKCVNDSLVILIDELTASASEILAGAIQDNDRGLIVGRRSFGKGLVQQQTEFSDGSAIRLVVSRYYTPTGRCIQKPYKKGTDEYYNDLNERFQHGEFEIADSFKHADSLKFVTPKGHIVYGGGGIMPDVFVPLDTTGYSEFSTQGNNKGLIYQFAFEYSDKNRAQLSKLRGYKAIEGFLDKQDLINKFISYVKRSGSVPNIISIKKLQKQVEPEIYAYIARNFIDNDGFYPIINKVDKTVLKAVQLLK